LNERRRWAIGTQLGVGGRDGANSETDPNHYRKKKRAKNKYAKRKTCPSIAEEKTGRGNEKKQRKTRK